MDYYILFIHPSVDGRLGCLHFLAFMSNDAVSILVQVFAQMHLKKSLGYVSRGEIGRDS